MVHKPCTGGGERAEAELELTGENVLRQRNGAQDKRSHSRSGGGLPVDFTPAAVRLAVLKHQVIARRRRHAAAGALVVIAERNARFIAEIDRRGRKEFAARDRAVESGCISRARRIQSFEYVKCHTLVLGPVQGAEGTVVKKVVEEDS